MVHSAQFNLKYLLLIATALLTGRCALGQVYPPQDVKRAAYMDSVRKVHPRVQVPTPPYHYTVEDVRFTDPGTGLTYGGTFTKPSGLKSFPSVVLISGTSPSDRDYTCYDHKYFWVLADYLSNQGIGVLRLDDRSTGETNGVYVMSTTMDFAKDILAGVTWLHTRTDIDTSRIGLVGHSEGGIIAPMTHMLAPAATKFLVLISGPITGLRYINSFQSRQQFALHYKGDTLEARMRLHQYVVDNIPARAHDYPELQKLLAWAVDTFYRTEDTAIAARLRISNDARGVEEVNRSYKTFMKPWWLFILTYDPVTDIRLLDCPVLGLFGDKDQQVPPQQNYQRLKDNLPANPYSAVQMIPYMNHFMQPDSTTGSWENYEKIPVTVMPEVLNKVAAWINRLPPAGKKGDLKK